MTATVDWTNTGDGYLYADELSDDLRVALQAQTKFRQFCEPDDGALNKGLHRGDDYRWNVYGDVAVQGRRVSELQPIPQTSFTVGQASLSLVELANSIPYTEKVTALAKHDVIKIIDKSLRNDARKAFDIEAFNQFDACLTRFAPTGGTSTTSITVTTNGATATTNNVAMGTGHVKAIADEMRERNVPGFVDDDYICLTHPTTLRPFKDELETLHQYTETGMGKVYNGEVGRYEGIRFVEQNYVPKGGANDSTTFDPYTRTADAWNNAKSSWAFFFGADTVNEAIVIPEEIRAQLPGDFGRSHAIAWYYLGGFGIFHGTDATQSRIFKWDSAA